VFGLRFKHPFEFRARPSAPERDRCERVFLEPHACSIEKSIGDRGQPRPDHLFAAASDFSFSCWTTIASPRGIPQTAGLDNCPSRDW